MDEKISELATLLSQGATLNGDSLVPMTVELPMGGGLKTVRVKFSELITALGYIPLQGTDVGNPVTGDIEFNLNGNINVGLKLESTNIARIGFFDEESPEIYFASNGDSDTSSRLNFYGGAVSISLRNTPFESNFDFGDKGIDSNIYHGANYTDNTYVQKKYVDTAMIPLDYGDIVSAGGIENTQVYTTGTGIGIASVDLSPIMAIGKDVTVSDLGNNASTHNIQIDSGIGNTILYNGTESQDITLNTNGASVTIRKITATKFMVI